MKIAVTFKILAARQNALENILIKHGLTTKDEIQSLEEKYFDEFKPIDDIVEDELLFFNFNQIINHEPSTKLKKDFEIIR